MDITHLSSFTAFILSSLGLAFHRTHLVSALLCLEGIILAMYLALATQPIQNQSASLALTPIFMLTFSACEASTGLAILVASTRTHGSDHLHNLNALQC
ncbi:NU4LM oxidoreductase, partial [Serilophus lunatus]|nr:NU4LM oxidoreductase [Serilophus lunatus]